MLYFQLKISLRIFLKSRQFPIDGARSLNADADDGFFRSITAT